MDLICEDVYSRVYSFVSSSVFLGQSPYPTHLAFAFQPIPQELLSASIRFAARSSACLHSNRTLSIIPRLLYHRQLTILRYRRSRGLGLAFRFFDNSAVKIEYKKEYLLKTLLRVCFGFFSVLGSFSSWDGNGFETIRFFSCVSGANVPTIQQIHSQIRLGMFNHSRTEFDTTRINQTS